MASSSRLCFWLVHINHGYHAIPCGPGKINSLLTDYPLDIDLYIDLIETASCSLEVLVVVLIWKPILNISWGLRGVYS